MANKNTGLGKGLSALLGDDFTMNPAQAPSTLPISQVESYAGQPRKNFDQEKLEELAESIRQHGIIQPLTVRKLSSGYYQIIAGERRWRAARLAGLTEVPAVIIEADDRKAMELAMIENLQREDLSPMEEAEGYKILVENYGMTQEQAAQRVGKSRSAVANALRLLALSPALRQMVEEGRLSAGHARALLPLSPALQEQAAATIHEKRPQRPPDGAAGQAAPGGAQAGEEDLPRRQLRGGGGAGAVRQAGPGLPHCPRQEEGPH